MTEENDPPAISGALIKALGKIVKRGWRPYCVAAYRFTRPSAGRTAVEACDGQILVRATVEGEFPEGLYAFESFDRVRAAERVVYLEGHADSPWAITDDYSYFPKTALDLRAAPGEWGPTDALWPIRDENAPMVEWAVNGDLLADVIAVFKAAGRHSATFRVWAQKKDAPVTLEADYGDVSVRALLMPVTLE